MRVLLGVVLGVWALFWFGTSLVAVFGGDVLGFIAFNVIGGLPWLWLGGRVFGGTSVERA